MASLNGQTIASSYEQLLHTDTDGGGNGNTLVTIKDGDNGTTFGLKLATNKVEVIPSAADDANAFEVSKNDGTAVFTVNTSTVGATLVGALSVTGDTTITSATSAKPELTIKNTNADASAPELVFIKDSSSPADDDEAGRIYMFADDDGGNQAEAFLAISKLTDVSNGSEDSNFDMYTLAGGTQKATLSLSSGLVGINYTTPSSMNDSGNNLVIGSGASGDNTGLTIFSNSDSSGSIHFADGTSGDAAYRGIVAYTHSSDAMRFFTSGTEKARIDSSGDVGIGTTSPRISTAYGSTNSKYLTVTNGSTGPGILTLSADRSTNGHGVGRIEFTNANNADASNNDADGKTIASITTNLITSDSNSGDDSGGEILFSTKPEAGSLAERMSIGSTGMILINDNDTGSAGSTLKQLSLGTSDNTALDFTNSGTIAGAIISNSSNTDDSACGVVFSHRTGSSGISYVASRNEGADRSALYFGTRGSDGVQLRMEIRNDGVMVSKKGLIFDGTNIGGSQTGIASSGTSSDMNFYTNGNNAMVLTTGKELTVARGSTPIGGTINAYTQNGRWGVMVDDVFGNDALIDFRDNGTSIGNITIVSGNVSYNTFIGSHYSSLTTDNEDDIEIGTVLSTIDETHTRHLAKFKVSDVVGDTRVYGVFAGWDGMYEGEGTQATISALGATEIRVTGACEGGDLLESNGDGTAKVQDDDIIRSKTIGKVTIGNSDTGVKLVSCVLYCG